jgi:outer membrane protein OmpA-like peptidoglycan-associated protein
MKGGMKIRLTYIFLLMIQAITAQTNNKTWIIGLWGIKTEYIGDLGNNVFKFNQDFHAGAALSVERSLNRHFDLGLQGAVSKTGMNNGISTYNNYEQWNLRSQYNNETKNFTTKRLYNFNLYSKFNFCDINKSRFIPFVGLTAGMAIYSYPQTSYIDANGERQTMFYQRAENNWKDEKTVSDFTPGVLAGFEFRINKKYSIRYQSAGYWTNHDNRDFFSKGSTDLGLQHGIGLILRIGGTEIERGAIPSLLEKKPYKAYKNLKDTGKLKLPEVSQCNYVGSNLVEAGPIHFFFKHGDHHLAAEDCTLLDSLASELCRKKEYTITLSGHTDNTGSAAYNQVLSTKRNAAVMQYLIKNGVEANRVVAKSYGSRMPAIENNSKVGHFLNRRVEISFVKKE